MVTIDNTPNPLPCRHQFNVIKQIEPTINLLKGLNTLHPDILLANDIEPVDYHDGLVFRSAIESIRGTYIASSTPGRQNFVKSVLEAMRTSGRIRDFDQLSSQQRWDFEVFPRDDDYLAVIEVKGGEGNSINISERSRLVKEFAIWSHIDGSIQHHPSHSAHLIINRLASELSVRNKQVDMLIFRDALCGTRARPCPKYPGREIAPGSQIAPDIFLFPQTVPTLSNPTPPPHSLDTLHLPKLLLNHFGVSEEDYAKHIWEVHVQVIQKPGKTPRLQRITNIFHQGQIVDSGRGRAFSQIDQ